MLKRAGVAVFTVAGAGALASLGVIGTGQSAHGVLNVCVTTKSTLRFQSGSTSCQAVGPNNTSVAVGDNTSSTAVGDRNSSVTVGSESDALAVGTKNTAATVGTISSSSTAVGFAAVAVATTDLCSANALGSKVADHC